MNYSEVYKRGRIIFEYWHDDVIRKYGKFQMNLIDELFMDMKLAWIYVPGLEHYWDGDNSGESITDEELEMILKYFHENPDKWKEFLNDRD